MTLKETKEFENVFRRLNGRIEDFQIATSEIRNKEETLICRNGSDTINKP